MSLHLYYFFIYIYYIKELSLMPANTHLTIQNVSDLMFISYNPLVLDLNRRPYIKILVQNHRLVESASLRNVNLKKTITCKCYFNLIVV